MKPKNRIEIVKVNFLRGPNIWTYRSVIEALVDIGELEEFPSNTLPGFYERLVEYLPGLIEHRCSPGVRGGFLMRLKEGTWAAHILEHVALELQTMSGMSTGFGKARETSVKGVYKVAFRSREEQVGRKAVVMARDLVMAAINDTSFDVLATVTSLRDTVEAQFLGPSTAHIVDAAIDRDIPFIRLTQGNLVQLGYGAAARRIWTAETDRTSAIAEEIAGDKDLTKKLLKACGVPVPEGVLVRSPEAAWEAAQDIGTPVAVKPYDGNHGRGVLLELETQVAIEGAYQVAKEQSGGSVIVEQFIPGDEHRLLVVGKQVVAVSKGEAAWVLGDGVQTISQLVDSQLNTDPRRGHGEEFPLSVIETSKSPEILLELERVGLAPHSIPHADRRVLIQRNGNVAWDVTDTVHPSVANVAALAARVVGLDIAGIDMVLEDASKPMQSQRGAVIEVNASPGLLAHIKPANGEGRPVGEAILSHLFEAQATGRIPIVGICGTQSTGRLARLVAWLVHINGKHVGLACSEGLYLNDRRIDAADSSHWEAGQRLLINRSVQAAVFENSSQTILATGLAYDKCSVGIVTDVSWEPKLVAYDVLNKEQAFKVIRTQVDVVLPTGTAVLNSADSQAVEMAELCDGKVIFYGLDMSNKVITKHLAKTGGKGGGEGERAVVLNDGFVVLLDGDHSQSLVCLADLKPTNAAQPEMVLAAVAAAWALELPTELIAAGLRTFDSGLNASLSKTYAS